MSVKPTLLKDIWKDLRKTPYQIHQAKTGSGNYNRYDVLDPRARTFSTGKRQLDSSDSSGENALKTPRLDANLVFSQLKNHGVALTEMDSLLKEIDNTQDPEKKDPRLDAVCKVVRLLVASQKNLALVVLDSFKAQEAAKISQATSLAPKTVAAISGTGTGSNNNGRKPAAPAPADDGKKKLKQVLRDAEKKTVLFNLNLGPNPLMNKDLISRKVTESLCATVKSGLHDYHIGDAEEVLDDILSCSKLEFHGSSTRQKSFD
jgi:hypothetical protein